MKKKIVFLFILTCVVILSSCKDPAINVVVDEPEKTDKPDKNDERDKTDEPGKTDNPDEQIPDNLIVSNPVVICLDNRAVVQWKYEDETKYLKHYSLVLKEGSSQIETKNTNQTFFVFENIDNNKEYVVEISAVNTEGKSTVFETAVIEPEKSEYKSLTDNINRYKQDYDSLETIFSIDEEGIIIKSVTEIKKQCHNLRTISETSKQLSNDMYREAYASGGDLGKRFEIVAREFLRVFNGLSEGLDEFETRIDTMSTYSATKALKLVQLNSDIERLTELQNEIESLEIESLYDISTISKSFIKCNTIKNKIESELLDLKDYTQLNNYISSQWDIITLLNNVSDQIKIIAFNATLEAQTYGSSADGYKNKTKTIKGYCDEIIEITKTMKAELTKIQNSINE